MCQFFSALVLKNGDVLHHPILDSHSDLVTYFKLPDTTAHHQHYAKVELTPVLDWLDASTWQFRLDEQTAPGWWADVAEAAEAQCRAIVDRMILRSGTVPLIADGCWIVGQDATVRDLRSGRIVRAYGTVQAVWRGGTVQEVLDGGTVQVVVAGGTVQEVRRGGTVQAVGAGGTVQVVWRGGTVQEVLDGGTVQEVWDGGTVQVVVAGGTVQAVGAGGTIVRDYRLPAVQP